MKYFLLVITMMLTASLAEAKRTKLIAHRGGVVEGGRTENSKRALQAAIDRGYYMVEVDVRETKDGLAIAHHDADFRQDYGVDQRVAEMNWTEIKKLRASDGSRPLLFSEYAALCRGKIRVMLDIKPPGHSEGFYEAIEAVLREHALLDEAMIIGTSESRQWFLGKVRVGTDRNALRVAAKEDKDVAAKYMLFDRGRSLDETTFQWARSLRVPVVPAINEFHYADLENHVQAAKADVERLRHAGVEFFQIDSIYDIWLRVEE